MPYYLERRGSRYKLRLKDDPQHEFSSKYMTKKQAIAQMQAIEISKRQRQRNMSESGGNFFSNVLAKVKNGFSSIYNTLSAPSNILVNNLDEKKQYTDYTKDLLNKYGNFGIVSMMVEKQPVESKIMLLANQITNGGLRDLMLKHNIDEYYHLSLRVDVLDDLARVLSFRIEKNENISVIPYTPLPNSQYMKVPLESSNPLTMNVILTKTRLSLGEEHFYIYRFDSWNCADFIMEILRSNNLLTPQLEAFIYQNTEIIQKGMSRNTRNKLHAITKLASRIGHLRGRGIDNTKFRFL
jgi:hypothetical protein